MTMPNKMTTNGIGELIKHMRKSSGLTQRELGKKVGLADTAISAYEREAQNISVKTFLEIARLCDFEVIIKDKNSGEIVTVKKSDNK